MALIRANGRVRSEQTPEELEVLLTKALSDYSPEDIEVIKVAWRQEMERREQVAAGEEQALRGKTLYEHLGDAHFKSPPVSIKQFIQDEYYLGKIGQDIYPQLLDDLIEIFDGNYSEVICTGAIGVGKTFACSFGVCYLIYLLSLMRHPQRSFGLSMDTKIIIVGFSVSEDMAKAVVLQNIAGKVGASPYFKEHFTPRITKKDIRFRHADKTYSPVEVVAKATTDRGALGLAIFAALMDEADFMPKGKKSLPGNDRFGMESMAKAIYDQIRRRMKSRFGKNGKLFLPCSKTTFDSFIQQRIRAAEKDPTIFISDYALWDVKPGDYSEERFHVLCGTESVNSKIITDPEELKRILASLPDRASLVSVPMNFLPEFESDLEGSIRDTAGVATAAVSPFIQQRHKIVEMVDPSLVHPYSVTTLDPSLGGYFLWEHLVGVYEMHDPVGGPVRVMRPLLNPTAPRHVHIDAAISGCAAGIVMGHCGGEVQLARHGFRDVAPLFIVDFMLQIVPPPGGEIQLSFLRQLVYDMSRHGFRITRVTMDQYQSKDSLQQYQALGLDAALQPTNWEIYKCLKNAIYEGRVKLYRYAPLLRELRGLEADWERRKIVKPDKFEGHKGSKDVADSLASVIYSLTHHPDQRMLPPIVGMSSYGQSGAPSWSQSSGGGFGQPGGGMHQAGGNVPQRAYRGPQGHQGSYPGGHPGQGGSRGVQYAGGISQPGTPGGIGGGRASIPPMFRGGGGGGGGFFGGGW